QHGAFQPGGNACAGGDRRGIGPTYGTGRKLPADDIHAPCRNRLTGAKTGILARWADDHAEGSCGCRTTIEIVAEAETVSDGTADGVDLADQIGVAIHLGRRLRPAHA